MRKRENFVLAIPEVLRRLCVMGKARHKPISERLREAIKASGYSRYAIWKATGISQSVLSRFMSRQDELSMANADRLAEFFELELVRARKQRKKGG